MADERAHSPSLLFLDFEASSLSEASWPIEIGWAASGPDGPGGASEAWLVRPHPSWDTADWSRLSEAVHGIAPEILLADGLEAADAAARFLAAAAGRLVVADSGLDALWLRVLLRAAGREAETPPVAAFRGLCRTEGGRLYAPGAAPDGPPWRLRPGRMLHRARAAMGRAMQDHLEARHRAGPDARRLRAGWEALRASVDDALGRWRDWRPPTPPAG